MGTTAPRKKAGRPSVYDAKKHPTQAFKLALLGCTEPEIADVLGIARSTLNKWRDEHPAFSDALTRGRADADADVARSLYERAKGYSHKAVKHFFDSKTGKVVVATYTEHYPPDTAAATVWLSNRQRGRWSRTPDPAGGNDEAPPASVAVKRVDASVPEA